MKIKFNKFERVAGTFVVIAMVGAIAGALVVGVKKKWFESKTPLVTYFDYADGIYPGSEVQMQGLRVGAVDDVTLQSDNKVLVRFHVIESYAGKVKSDSKIRTMRTFIIGDKVLDLSVGSLGADLVMAHDTIGSEMSVDFMDMLSGRSLGPYMKTISGMVGNLEVIINAFSDPKRSKALVGMFDRIVPLMDEVHLMSKSMTKVSRQLTHKKNLKVTMGNLAYTTQELRTIMPEMMQMAKMAPEMTEDMAALLEKMTVMTTELTKVMPALAEIAPELPLATQKAVIAMDEAVIVLKAMQKSFMLRGSVEEVREEEALLKKEREEKLAQEMEKKKEREIASEEEAEQDDNEDLSEEGEDDDE